MSCKIIGFKNGPLEVDCKDATFIQESAKIEVENMSHPCRCGKSKNKPFCDGSHVRAGFSDQTEIKKEVLHIYPGSDITINFNRSICAGAGECVRSLATVFKTEGSQNWIFPDGDNNENIINTINACPSGALSYTIDGKTYIDTRIKPKMSILKNGPYAVEAIALEGMQSPTHFCASKYTLYRCGYSKNKPYCDYSHAEHDWDDES